MGYKIKEIFYTLQGEGVNTGRPAVFCRFTGCNLWSGQETDRATAICQFCDTDFVGFDGTFGGDYSAMALADTIENVWGTTTQFRFVVLTGGEPMLQVDALLVEALHAREFLIAVETNGTVKIEEDIDWICVSPKAGAPVIQQHGNELKVAVPQQGMDLFALESWAFDHFFLQPIDNVLQKENTHWATTWCMQNPKWKLSLQTHKMIGLR